MHSIVCFFCRHVVRQKNLCYQDCPRCLQTAQLFFEETMKTEKHEHTKRNEKIQNVGTSLYEVRVRDTKYVGEYMTGSSNVADDGATIKPCCYTAATESWPIGTYEYHLSKLDRCLTLCYDILNSRSRSPGCCGNRDVFRMRGRISCFFLFLLRTPTAWCKYEAAFPHLTLY